MESLDSKSVLNSIRDFDRSHYLSEEHHSLPPERLESPLVVWPVLPPPFALQTSSSDFVARARQLGRSPGPAA